MAAEPACLLCPLPPVDNEHRARLDLCGLWDFAVDEADAGVGEGWARGLPATARRSISVPGSWGEQLSELRDYLGPAWYFRRVELPRAWRSSRVLLRVGAASYACSLYVNGALLGVHEGAGLPFQVDCSAAASSGEALLIALRVEALLSPHRVPPGELAQRPQQLPNVGYDFFPWAGVHREVCLLSLPAGPRLEDATAVTRLRPGGAVLDVSLAASDNYSGGGAARLVRADGQGEAAAAAQLAFVDGAASASLDVPAARLWSPAAPHLYRLQLLLCPGSCSGWAEARAAAEDSYELTLGLRTVEVCGEALLLNGAPLRLRGFGKHEDTPLLGRGWCGAAAVRDAACMAWTGANSYRTAHYPHAEASLALADAQGLAVIGETPAVYLCFHDGEEAQAARAAAARRMLAELIARDKNRACVLLWSLANEPEANAHLEKHGCRVPPPEDRAWEERGLSFFRDYFALARSLDATRPLTYCAHPQNPMSWVALCDVVCTNRYLGWYYHPGELRRGAASLGASLDREHAELRRPFILSEFGADAIAGTHAEPAEMWSEEYQTEMILAYLALGESRPWLVGFHVWTLTDFKTTQAIRRPQGLNHKGVFTRDRRPKAAAHALRAAWLPSLQAERAAAADAESRCCEE